MPRPISLSVSIPAMRHNLEVVMSLARRHAAQNSVAVPRVWAVIKAGAYGHGIDNAVRAFEQADGLAMLDLDEAIRCRELGWTRPILMLEGFFEAWDVPLFQQYGLTPVIHCDEQLDLLAKAEAGRPMDAWIKLNSGMNRLGFSPSRYEAAWQRADTLVQRGVLGQLGAMTHFSRADDDLAVTQAQRDIFVTVTRKLDGPVSLCNSAATLSPQVWSGVSADREQWLRPGVCLYGASPFADRPAPEFGLRPAQTLAASVLAVRDLAPGEAVGYGHQYTVASRMRMAVVACGYADGYPRLAASGTPLAIDGVRTKTLGRISMDMLVADVTHIPQAGPGSSVVLWGQGGPGIDEVAHSAGTIGYELMCAVATRVPRRIETAESISVCEQGE